MVMIAGAVVTFTGSLGLYSAKKPSPYAMKMVRVLEDLLLGAYLGTTHIGILIILDRSMTLAS